MAKVIYRTQNEILTLTVLNNLDQTRKWAGEIQPDPRITVALAPKEKLGPGQYRQVRDAALTHHLKVDAARLLFFDLTQKLIFSETYHVVADHDKGFHLNEPTGVANRLFVTYRRYESTGDERLILEIWAGPGKYDRHLNTVYPLDKEHQALAINLKPDIARQMALAVLGQIQVWETMTALSEYDLVPKQNKRPAKVAGPQQLALSLG